MVNSMAGLETLSAKLGMDAHQPAPEELKQFFKKYTGRSIDTENLFDITTINAADIENMPSGQREKAFAVFNNQTSPSPTPQKVYKFTQIPGMIMPSLEDGRLYMSLTRCRSYISPRTSSCYYTDGAS